MLCILVLGACEGSGLATGLESKKRGGVRSWEEAAHCLARQLPQGRPLAQLPQCWVNSREMQMERPVTLWVEGLMPLGLGSSVRSGETFTTGELGSSGLRGLMSPASSGSFCIFQSMPLLLTSDKCEAGNSTCIIIQPITGWSSASDLWQFQPCGCRR